jgi:transcriptional regulator with GAF, ATPase, and Fis domain
MICGNLRCSNVRYSPSARRTRPSLQEHEFERVGGSRTIQTSVRVIAATNRDLQASIAAGTFRSDLFYRLNVFPIEVPPLRARREDIPLLVEYFLDRFTRKAGKTIRGVE